MQLLIFMHNWLPSQIPELSIYLVAIRFLKIFNRKELK